MTWIKKPYVNAVQTIQPLLEPVASHPRNNHQILDPVGQVARIDGHIATEGFNPGAIIDDAGCGNADIAKRQHKALISMELHPGIQRQIVGGKQGSGIKDRTRRRQRQIKASADQPAIADVGRADQQAAIGNIAAGIGEILGLEDRQAAAGYRAGIAERCIVCLGNDTT